MAWALFHNNCLVSSAIVLSENGRSLPQKAPCKVDAMLGTGSSYGCSSRLGRDPQHRPMKRMDGHEFLSVAVSYQ